jgi:hypothetical protein
MSTEGFSFALSAFSALAGSAATLTWIGWWLRGNFTQVYRTIGENEIKHLQQMSDLRLQLVEIKIQMQTIEGLKPKTKA